MPGNYGIKLDSASKISRDQFALQGSRYANIFFFYYRKFPCLTWHSRRDQNGLRRSQADLVSLISRFDSGTLKSRKFFKLQENYRLLFRFSFIIK